MLIASVALFLLFATSAKQGLRVYRSSALEQALNKIASTCEESSPYGISYTTSALSVQRIEGIRDDGKLYWRKELSLFWLYQNTILQRRLTEDELSRNGIILSELQPHPLTAAELDTLLRSVQGRIVADSVSSFDISFDASKNLRLKGTFRDEQDKDSRTYLKFVELGL